MLKRVEVKDSGDSELLVGEVIDLLEINDINGKLIYNKTRNGLHNDLQISNIERGVYFIKVSSNNDRVVKRFVVQ